MNIFTNLPFLQNLPVEFHLFDEQDEPYARGYGNRIASERFFAPLGHGRAGRNPDTLDPSLIAVGGCA
ncbi:hypothetical protein QLQ15_03850 [Lysobacter sp. LF1]|uniref:Uncharacterized protein n=1 Tax=Lysobacter stagni TaxID=3045172 RepID=A0ABT6XDC3_9GAMM|nr:hypothetical protein [Lysobacter sp. LF1]MDI9238039.1 hypothetical protein [Lysobacter sp. LF1]